MVISGCEKPSIDEADEIRYLKAFASVYGYVKYFHPSDEAYELDWGKFAIYGADKVVTSRSDAEFRATMKALFEPIAPAIRFVNSPDDAYDLSAITPKDTSGYQQTYWQHRGLSKDMAYQKGIYRSRRVNAYNVYDTLKSPAGFGEVFIYMDGEPYRDQKLRYSGWVRVAEGSDALVQPWLRTDRFYKDEKVDRETGFLNNSSGVRFEKTSWEHFVIETETGSLIDNIAFGCMMEGSGTIYVDNLRLEVQKNGNWIDVPVRNADFEVDKINPNNSDVYQFRKGPLPYVTKVVAVNPQHGKRCVAISLEDYSTQVKGDPIFERRPLFGEILHRQILEGLYIQLPFVLMHDGQDSYPAAEKETIEQLSKVLNTFPINTAGRAFRLGNVINMYNVFRHFYPYFQEVDADWDAYFSYALQRSFSDQSIADHHKTLQIFLANLKDGHGYIRTSGIAKDHTLPLRWRWTEGKLLISRVFNDDLELQVGDVVTHIGNQTAQEYFVSFDSTQSAATRAKREKKSAIHSLID
ncbi:MAG: hypothetical protein AAFO69_19710, partial [Bacteroidota bacterium]